MKKVKGLYQLMFILLLLSCEKEADLTPSACGTEDPASEIEWVSETIAYFESSERSSFIELYSYKKRKVFLINDCTRRCRDWFTIAYNCDQKEICTFGGFGGFNTCPDFFDDAILIETIFRKE